jgi:hypothetical protein
VKCDLINSGFVPKVENLYFEWFKPD